MGSVWTDSLVPRGGGRRRKQLGAEGVLLTLRDVQSSGKIFLKSIKEPQVRKSYF